MGDTEIFETQETITFDEFKAWMSGFLQGKEGTPNARDWVLIQRMINKVIPEKEIVTVPSPYAPYVPSYPHPDIYPAPAWPDTTPVFPGTYPTYPTTWPTWTGTSAVELPNNIPTFTDGNGNQVTSSIAIITKTNKR